MQLMRNLIQIKLGEPKVTYAGGIIVKTDVAKIPAPRGKVVSVGPDVKEIKVGDEVIFGKHAAQDIGDGVLICEADVLAII